MGRGCGSGEKGHLTNGESQQQPLESPGGPPEDPRSSLEALEGSGGSSDLQCLPSMLSFICCCQLEPCLAAG